MKPRAVVSGAVVLLLALCVVPIAAGQHMVEVRGADTKYRYADWNYSFAKGAVDDVFYVGVPGSNEFNFGGGYAFKQGGLVVTPLVYGVVGKEGGQRGVKLALLVSVDKGGWKLLSFLGDYIPVSGYARPHAGDRQAMGSRRPGRLLQSRRLVESTGGPAGEVERSPRRLGRFLPVRP